MKAPLIDFFTKYIYSYEFNLIKLKRNWLIIIFFISINFSLFRWLNYTESKNVNKSIEVILRDEYLNASSYLLAKRISDLETIGMIRCVKLVEHALELDREYYNTSNYSSCIKNLYLKKYSIKHTTLNAINGLKYEMQYELPINIFALALEALLYLLGITLILIILQKNYVYRKLNEHKLKTLFLEKELTEDRTKQVKHDIASPIGVIKIISDTLPKESRYRILLEKSLNRLEQIFIDLNKEPSSKHNKQYNYFSIKEVIQNIEIEKNVSWAKKVTFTSSGVTQLVSGDANEFSRIISNVFDNSMEAMINKKIKCIHWELISDNKFVYINIKDTGIGLPHELQGSIGKKGFTYGKEELSSGSGIGLYHAFKTIKSWGGQINLNSDPVQGTTIHIILKRYKPFDTNQA